VFLKKTLQGRCAYSGLEEWRYTTPTPINNHVRNAAIAVLLGGNSTVSNYCYFFGIHPSGIYDIWFSRATIGQNLPIVIGNNFYRNVYYSRFGDVHNMETNKKDDAVTLYNHINKNWYN